MDYSPQGWEKIIRAAERKTIARRSDTIEKISKILSARSRKQQKNFQDFQDFRA